jgi:hypothetical protein
MLILRMMLTEMAQTPTPTSLAMGYEPPGYCFHVQLVVMQIFPLAQR